MWTQLYNYIIIFINYTTETWMVEWTIDKTKSLTKINICVSNGYKHLKLWKKWMQYMHIDDVQNFRTRQRRLIGFAHLEEKRNQRFQSNQCKWCDTNTFERLMKKGVSSPKNIYLSHILVQIWSTSLMQLLKILLLLKLERIIAQSNAL